MKHKLIFNLLVFFSLCGYSQEPPVKWEYSSKKITSCEYDIIFNATINEPWHMYSTIKSEGDDGPNPTSFKFKPSKDYELVGKIKESKPIVEIDKLFETKVGYFEHNATFTQRIKLKSTTRIVVSGKYEFQACTDDKCIFPPADEFELFIQGTSECADKTISTTTTNTTSNTTVKEDTAANQVVVNKIDSLNSTTNVSPTSPTNNTEPASETMSWWSILLKGFIGGFAALLTPCVFPMIPMNVSFFTKQSKTKSQGMFNALVYGISIIVLYVSLGLGVTLLYGPGALHTLSTNVWFNLAFFALLLVFAISFLGAFEITLPSKFVNKIDSKADKGGFIGIFFMAFTLALVSFSCTGPIIGTLLVDAASTGNISGPFWGMFGFSLALALPFGVFAAFPGWLNSLPKSGGWLNSVKVTLGFLELALALKFASNADLVIQAGILTREVFITLWIVIFGLLGLYLLGVFKTSHDSDVKHVSVTRLFFAIAALFMTTYLIPGLWGAPLKLLSGILPPHDYSESPHGFGGNTSAKTNTTLSIDPEFDKYIHTNKNGIIYFKNDYEHALAYAKKIGKPLLVDFTGHACANCRKTEDYVWPDAEVTKRLNNQVVLVSLYVDDKRPLDPKDYMTVNWYGKQRQITDIGDKFKYLEETMYGQSTQPLYVLLDHNEKRLSDVRGYNPSIENYVKWLDEGINKFKTR